MQKRNRSMLAHSTVGVWVGVCAVQGGVALYDLMISLVGEQPIPNIIAPLKAPPRRLALLGSPWVGKVQDDLKSSLSTLLPETEVTDHPVDPYSVQSTYDVALKIMNDHRGARIISHVTGGTKLMSIGLYQAAVGMKTPVLYVDTQSRVVRDIGPVPSGLGDLGLPKLSVETYLNAYGRKILAQPISEPTAGELEAADFLSCFNGEEAFLNQHLQSNPGKDTLSIPVRQVPPDLRFIEFVQGIKKRGLVTEARWEFRERNHSLSLAGPEATDFLRGKWFELWVYSQTAKCGFDDVRRDITIGWGPKSSNQVDAIACHKAKLLIISCKAGAIRNIPGSHLNELPTLARLAGGIYAKGVIVLNRTLGPGDEAMLDRARELRIEVIDRGGLPELPERLKKVIGETGS